MCSRVVFVVLCWCVLECFVCFCVWLVACDYALRGYVCAGAEGNDRDGY